jgi:hypothetical protein
MLILHCMSMLYAICQYVLSMQVETACTILLLHRSYIKQYCILAAMFIYNAHLICLMTSVRCACMLLPIATAAVTIIQYVLV